MIRFAFRDFDSKLVYATPPFELDARSIQFPVDVAANGEAAVRYEVRYSW